MMTELRIREIAEAEGLALDDLPGHRAAARRRSEDEALGREQDDRIGAPGRGQGRGGCGRRTGRPRRGADGDVDEDELAEEVADDDGMAGPGGRRGGRGRRRRGRATRQTQRRRADG